MKTTCDPCEHIAKTSAATTLLEAAGEAATARTASRCRTLSRRSTSRRARPVSVASFGGLSSPRASIGVAYEFHDVDAFTCLVDRAEYSIDAIATDPPYSLKEYTAPDQAKLRAGIRGIRRTPPSFDATKRMGLPRFTDLSDSDIQALCVSETFAQFALQVLPPDSHVMIAANLLHSQHADRRMTEAGFEKRAKII